MCRLAVAIVTMAGPLGGCSQPVPAIGADGVSGGADPTADSASAAANVPPADAASAGSPADSASAGPPSDARPPADSGSAAPPTDAASAVPPADAASGAPPRDFETEPPPPESVEVTFSAHYPPEASVQLLAWRKARRFQGPTFEQTCWELGERVGSPPALGLLCTVSVSHPPKTVGRVYRVEGTRLHQVWEATLATYANWLELTPLLAPDGTSLVLHDRKPGACLLAIREYHLKLESRVAPPSGDLLEPACSMRGTYTFERGRYRLTDPVVDQADLGVEIVGD